jgi:type I restriction enzyme S subunit
MQWRQCRLGDLLEIRHGYAFSGKYFGRTGTHIVLTPGNFFDEGGFKDKGDNEKWYAGPIPRPYVLNSGDLIVAMTEQAEGLLGSSAIIPKSDLYLHNQRLGLVQVREDTTDKTFLYYLFNLKLVRQQIRASATGVKIRHTAPSRIAEVTVTIPPLTLQREIADILSAYDESIAKNRRRIQILDEMARRLYREWFVEFRFPGHEKIARTASSAGDIPKDWKVMRVHKVATVNRAQVNPREAPDVINYVDILPSAPVRSMIRRPTLSRMRQAAHVALCSTETFCGLVFGQTVDRMRS